MFLLLFGFFIVTYLMVLSQDIIFIKMSLKLEYMRVLLDYKYSYRSKSINYSVERNCKHNLGEGFFFFHFECMSISSSLCVYLKKKAQEKKKRYCIIKQHNIVVLGLRGIHRQANSILHSMPWILLYECMLELPCFS